MDEYCKILTYLTVNTETRYLASEWMRYVTRIFDEDIPTHAVVERRI